LVHYCCWALFTRIGGVLGNKAGDTIGNSFAETIVEALGTLFRDALDGSVSDSRELGGDRVIILHLAMHLALYLMLHSVVLYFKWT
jgi:hypothetical protein